MKKLAIISFCFIFTLTLCGCKSDKPTQSSYLSYELVDSSNSSQPSSESQPSNEPEKPQNTSSQEPQKVKKSTVIAPYKIVFYKNGRSVESADTAQNLKIAKHIESYFKSGKTMRCHCAIKDSQIKDIRATEMAVEIFFDQSFTFYGGVISEKTRTLFIPLTGDKAGDMIQNNDDGNYDHSGGPIKYAAKSLAQFFPKNLDAPFVPQESKDSTVIAPYKVVFYKNGKTAESTDAVQNLKIAKHIEAYFEGMTEIGQYELLVEESIVNITKSSKTAVELFFDQPFTFCGGIIHERTRTLFIPLTGEYKNMIIDDDDGNYEDAMGPLVYYPKGLIEFFPETLNN